MTQRTLWDRCDEPPTTPAAVWPMAPAPRPVAEIPPTSLAAAKAVKEPARAMRERIYELIAGKWPDGLTCDEVERMTGLKHQTASARMADLKRTRRIRDSGRTRPTESGCPAAVMVMVSTT